MMKPLVLASASPRRKALLAALGVAFEVIPSRAEESHAAAPPEVMVENNACLKRDDVAGRLEGPSVVIAADTLVFIDGDVLPKPGSLDEARRMLHHLSGRTHHVATGLALCDTETGRTVQATEITAVTFRALDRHEIDHFVDTVNPLDRAGAYTVDGPGSLLVARYEGCYQNVLGFPMVRLDTLLRHLGVFLFDRMDPSAAVFL